MSQIPRAPSVSQLFAIADHRASPQPVGQPFQAQPGQSAGYRFVGQLPPHLAMVPAGIPANRGMTGQAPPPSAPATTTGFQVSSLPGPGNLIPVPTGIYDTGRGYPAPSAAVAVAAAAAPVPPRPSYITVLRRGNVGINCVWQEPVLTMLAEFELEFMRVTEEKRRAYWKAWVDSNEPQSEARDETQKKRFLARQLRSYAWYNGDETLVEAMAALDKIDEFFTAFANRKREEIRRAAVNRVHPGLTAMLFPEVAKDNMRVDLEANRRSRAHIEEAEDEEQ